MRSRNGGLGNCDSFVPVKTAVFWDKTARCQPSTTVSKSQMHTFSGPRTGIFELGNISKQVTIANILLYLILPRHYALTFRHRSFSMQDRRFATLQRTLIIYLINKYISLSVICLTVHH